MEDMVIKFIYLAIIFVGVLYCMFSFLPLFLDLASFYKTPPKKPSKKFMKMNEKN
jgi:hypothetical protein